tara:strand:+ start:8107 stop:8856 length:750 start_codon:yes stop_codon:yes gene_type:complete
MKTVLLIPARYGSKRFEGKPLAKIAGKPMIQHVYERAKMAKGIDAIYITTDDVRIADCAQSFGCQTLLTHTHAASGTDRIDQAAQQLQLNDDDLIINVQGDQPLVHPHSIEQLVALFHNATDTLSMATSAYCITDATQRHDPKHVKVVFNQNYDALYFSRACIPFGRDTQDYPVYKHLGLYAYTRGFVRQFAKQPLGQLEDLEKLEQLRALEYGAQIKMTISEYDSPEVDTPEDIRACESILQEEVLHN